MKKLQLIALLIIMIGTVTLISCDKEPIEHTYSYSFTGYVNPSLGDPIDIEYQVEEASKTYKVFNHFDLKTETFTTTDEDFKPYYKVLNLHHEAVITVRSYYDGEVYKSTKYIK